MVAEQITRLPNMEMKEISIIFVHFSTGNIRSYIAINCLMRFWRMARGGVEIIVINNSKRDGNFKEMCHKYFDNPSNNFAYARNLGAENAEGKYLCFVDNDIYPDRMFWSQCRELLEKYPDKKLIATPIWTPCHIPRYNRGELDGHILNLRSGSNCLFMTKETFLDIGKFDETLPVHQVGVDFCNRQINKGYLVIHTEPALARDLGIRRFPYSHDL